jgi:hypothetical protein
MNEVERLTEKINRLQGSLLAMECLVNALVEQLDADQRLVVHALHASETEAFRSALSDAAAPAATVDGFERDVRRAQTMLDDPRLPAPDEP